MEIDLISRKPSLLYGELNGVKEVAFTYGSTSVNIAVGSHMKVDPNNMCLGRQKARSKSMIIGVSRVLQAFDTLPDFATTHIDNSNKIIYGIANVNGSKCYWKINENGVYTTIENESLLSDRDLINLVLFPKVLYMTFFSNDVPELVAFNKKMPDVEKNDYLLAMDAFYFSIIKHPVVNLYTNCAENAVLPNQDNSKSNINGKTLTKLNTVRPWKKSSLEAVPNDYSVASALAGKYRLEFKCPENTGDYSFKDSILDLSFLNNYVDTYQFRSCLGQIVSYVNDLFRSNKTLSDSETDTEAVNIQISDSYNHALSRKANLMLSGVPGTGKTMLARALAAALGLPISILRFGERTEIEALTEYVRAGENGFETIKSTLYYFVKHGGIVVLDDVSNMDSNTLFTVMGGLLEAPFSYEVGGNIVKRHPLCIMIATANVGTEGSRSMNEAFLSRFGTQHLIEPLTENQLKECLWTTATKRVGYDFDGDETKKNNLLDWVYRIYSFAYSAVSSKDSEIAGNLLTMRSAETLLEMLLSAYADEITIDPTLTAIDCIANILYASGNIELQKLVVDGIMNTPALQM